MAIKLLSLHLGIRCDCQCGGRRKRSILTMPGANSRRRECERRCEEGNREKGLVGMDKGNSPAKPNDKHSSSSHQKRQVRLVTYRRIPHQTNMQVVT